MNDKIALMREFIRLYDATIDKEAVIAMCRNFVNEYETPLTLADAFDAVEGEAWAQVYANME